MFVLSSGDAEEKYRQLAEENDAKDVISGDLDRIGSAVVVAEERMVLFHCGLRQADSTMCDEEEDSLETPSSSVKCQHIMTIIECMEWRVEPSAAGEVAGLILLILILLCVFAG